ncbi:MAG: hypothetical protein AAF950_14830 [Pseudomonadota bacterium]
MTSNIQKAKQMKQSYILGFAALALIATPQIAQAEPNNANQFKRTMQNASHARLNTNGSNVLRFDADQDTVIKNTAVANGGLRTNSIDIDDSLIANLDVYQSTDVRQASFYNSGVTLNDADLTRARSQMTDINQTAKLRNFSAVNAGIHANTISVR